MNTECRRKRGGITLGAGGTSSASRLFAGVAPSLRGMQAALPLEVAYLLTWGSPTLGPGEYGVDFAIGLIGDITLVVPASYHRLGLH